MRGTRLPSTSRLRYQTWISSQWWRGRRTSGQCWAVFFRSGSGFQQTIIIKKKKGRFHIWRTFKRTEYVKPERPLKKWRWLLLTKKYFKFNFFKTLSQKLDPNLYWIRIQQQLGSWFEFSNIHRSGSRFSESVSEIFDCKARALFHEWSWSVTHRFGRGTKEYAQETKYAQSLLRILLYSLYVCTFFWYLKSKIRHFDSS